MSPARARSIARAAAPRSSAEDAPEPPESAQPAPPDIQLTPRPRAGGKASNMTLITVKFTTLELELLASLAADQMFRREFIDPKMPGYRVNRAEITLGKALVSKLRLLADPNTGRKQEPGWAAGGSATQAPRATTKEF